MALPAICGSDYLLAASPGSVLPLGAPSRDRGLGRSSLGGPRASCFEQAVGTKKRFRPDWQYSPLTRALERSMFHNLTFIQVRSPVQPSTTPGHLIYSSRRLLVEEIVM